MGERILIIDDEPNLRAMMRLALEAAGYAVGEAAGGFAGLELYGAGANWDLVLLDQRMPDAEGVDVLRRRKERAPHARVIMVTAFSSVELAVGAMKAGATDFVRKPMTPAVLRQAVAAALARPGDGVAAGEGNARHPSTEMVTLNGYRVRPAETATGESSRRRFVVTGRRDQTEEVVVEIDAEAIAYVERMTGRRLAAASPFWTAPAERFLSDFIWNEGRPPAGGRLTLRGVDAEGLDAARWRENNS